MPLSRRELLLAGLGLTAISCTSDDLTNANQSTSSATTSTPATTTTTTTAVPTLVDAPTYDGPSPFVLGVASGDPDANSIVLWTRLLSAIDEVLPKIERQVAVDVAHDSDFNDLVSSTVAEAPHAYGHSVHALATNLEPDTWYWYRFRIGEYTSPTGRTRTLPDANSDTPLRFGFSSCQNWESGAYGAHRLLAEEELDLFVWLGDYIYEYGPGNGGVVSSAGERIHNSSEVETLDGYRSRYAQYKSDAHLQAHHATRPWFVTWDDHEVDNNLAGLTSQDGQDVDDFRERRRMAHQAWWENMPVRLEPPDNDGQLQIYRSASWGSLVDLHMLDGRQYRAPQPTDGDPLELPGDFGVRLLGPTALDPEHSMLGAEQRAWLEAQVTASSATWNVLGNQVFMHGLNAFPGDVPATNTDTWDGYAGERKALLDTLATANTNVVVLSGDFHSSSAADLRADPFDLASDIVGAEFMAPAISSRFPESLRPLAPLAVSINPQVRYFSPENGFMTCEVSNDSWTTTVHLLSDVTDEDTTVASTATIAVNAGTPGIASVS